MFVPGRAYGQKSFITLAPAGVIVIKLFYLVSLSIVTYMLGIIQYHEGIAKNHKYQYLFVGCSKVLSGIAGIIKNCEGSKGILRMQFLTETTSCYLTVLVFDCKY